MKWNDEREQWNAMKWNGMEWNNIMKQNENTNDMACILWHVKA